MRARTPVQLELRYKLSPTNLTGFDVLGRLELSTRLGTNGVDHRHQLWSILWDCIFEMGYQPYNKT